MADKNKKPKLESFAVDYVIYNTRLTDKFRNRKFYEERDPRKIYAFIPGTIKAVNIKIGQKIKAGDKLAVLEAMKMNNIITSDIDGTIKKINIKAGQSVAKEEVLIEIE